MKGMKKERAPASVLPVRINALALSLSRGFRIGRNDRCGPLRYRADPQTKIAHGRSERGPSNSQIQGCEAHKAG